MVQDRFCTKGRFQSRLASVVATESTRSTKMDLGDGHALNAAGFVSKQHFALGARALGMKACFQPLGVILPAKEWATILPFRTTNVSVPTSYTLSAVSAVHRVYA